MLNSNTSFTMSCPGNMVSFVPLAAEIGLPVWGTSANFNGFRILAALLHGTLVVGVSQTLRRWTEGATYIRQAAITLGIGPHSSFQRRTEPWPQLTCTEKFHELWTRGFCDMRVDRHTDTTFLRPAFAASRVQQVSDLHLKFALRPHHVWKYGRHQIYGRWD